MDVTSRGNSCVDDVTGDVVVADDSGIGPSSDGGKTSEPADVERRQEAERA